MIYSFQLCPHANIRFSEALVELGRRELLCLMQSVGISAQIDAVSVGRSTFFRFACPVLTEEQLLVLETHSSLLLMCQEENGLLHPLPSRCPPYLPADLPELFKYKGKTSARFTYLCLNCARAAAGLTEQGPLTVLDPLCGRGTTLFCALTAGHNAFGIDMDRHDLEEAGKGLAKWLEYHRIKHAKTVSSMTVSGKGIPVTTYTVSDSREHFAAGDTRTLSLCVSDTQQAGALLKRHPADLLVADLPYGVQHGPGSQNGITRFDAFLSRVLPSWHDALRPGGAMALSMNTFTLKKDLCIRLLQDAGFEPLTEPPYDSFLHDVEQAVRRDLVISIRR